MLFLILSTFIYADTKIVLPKSMTDGIQIQKSIKLRYGATYYFNNSFNAGSQYVFINNFHGTTFLTKAYNGDKEPTFGFSKEFAEKKFEISPYTSELIYSSTDGYTITNKPSKRLEDNIIIKHVVNYSLWFTKQKKWVKAKVTTLQPYEITWCGDGIIDNYIDRGNGNKSIIEECDIADKNKINWGKNGCSNQCMTIK